MISGELPPILEEQALEVARRRQAENVAAGRQNRIGEMTREAELEAHLRGARAEAFVAFCYRVEWIPRSWSDRHLPDVANVDVRYARRGGLEIYRRDPADRAFVLVTGDGELQIEGWMWAIEAKRAAWWNQDLRAACFVVPAPALYPPETLPISEVAQ